MIDLNINAQDFEEFAKHIVDIVGGIEAVNEDVAKTIRSLVMGRTPVDTGDLKRSWSQLQKNDGGFSFSNEMPYANILEEGWENRKVGPRTVRQGNRIYSRQAPGGMAGPVMDDESLISRIAEKVIQELAKGIDNAAP